MTSKLFFVRLSPYQDHGTGHTTAQQSAWLAAAVRKLNNMMQLPAPADMGWDQENLCLWVELQPIELAWAALKETRDEAERIGTAIEDGEAAIRSEVERILGRDAAYCSVRTASEQRWQWPHGVARQHRAFPFCGGVI